MTDISFESENVSRFSPKATSERGQVSILSDHLRCQESGERQILPMSNLLSIVQRLRNRIAIMLTPQVDYPSGGGADYGHGMSLGTRIPQPYPVKYSWPPDRDVAKLPSVMGVLSGPEHTVLPQRDISVQV